MRECMLMASGVPWLPPQSQHDTFGLRFHVHSERSLMMFGAHIYVPSRHSLTKHQQKSHWACVTANHRGGNYLITEMYNW